MTEFYKKEDVIDFLNLHCPKDEWEYQIADLPTIKVMEYVDKEQAYMTGYEHGRIAGTLTNIPTNIPTNVLEDCISRQQAIEALVGWQTEPLDEDIVRTLNNLPPVTPTERTGEWIVHSLLDEGIAELECPICGDIFIRAIDYKPHFCEHCGAKMKG